MVRAALPSLHFKQIIPLFPASVENVFDNNYSAGVASFWHRGAGCAAER
jgi:hypothetical protein